MPPMSNAERQAAFRARQKSDAAPAPATVTDAKTAAAGDELARLFAEEAALDAQLVATLATVGAPGASGRRARAAAEELRAEIEDARVARATLAQTLRLARAALLDAQARETRAEADALDAQVGALLGQLAELTGWRYIAGEPASFLAPHAIVQLRAVASSHEDEVRRLRGLPLLPPGQLRAPTRGSAAFWAAYEALDPAIVAPDRERVRAWAASYGGTRAEDWIWSLAWGPGAVIDGYRSQI